MSEIYGYTGLDTCDKYILNNPTLTVDRNDCLFNDDFAVVCKDFLTPCTKGNWQTTVLDALQQAVATTKTDDLIKLFDKESVGDLTLAFRMQNHHPIYCRMGAKPLIIGIGNNGNYLCEQINDLQGLADKYIALNAGEKAKITKDKVVVFNSKGVKIKKTPQPVKENGYREYDYTPADEVYCLSNAINNALLSLTGDSKINLDYLKITPKCADKIRHIVLIGEGTDNNANQCAKYVFELLCNIPTTALSSTEFIHGAKIVDKNTLLIALSQKGETTTTVWGADYAKRNGARVIGITSDITSHLARICPFVINPDCQMTASQVSLKSFVNSYTSLCFLALYIGQKRGIVSDLYLSVAIKMAQMLTGKIMESTKSTPTSDMLIYTIKNAQNLIFTGCGIDYPMAEEACAKLCDIRGTNACPLPMDILQHINADNHTVFAIISNKDYLTHSHKILKALQQQGAKVVIITTSNIEAELTDFDHIVSFGDSIPIFNILPMLAGLYKTATSNQSQQKMETVS